MTTAIQRRRGTTSEHTTFTGLLGEVTVDTDKDTLIVHDGSTAGGFPLLREDLSNNTNVLTTTNTKTLSNKSISLESNTLTGTIAQFNAAVTDSDFVDTTSSQTIAGTKTFSSNPILSAGTANGVLYLNGSKVATSGSALTFDGTTFRNTAGGAAFSGVIGAGVSASANGRFRAFNSTNDRFVEIFNDGTVSTINSTFGSAGASPLTFQISDSEQMRLTSTGLGIGTSSPAYKLDLSTSYDGRGRVWFAALAFVGNNSNGTGYQLRTPTSTSDGLVISNGGNSAEWARIDSSGNLGLGVTPSAWNGIYKVVQTDVASLFGSSSYNSLTLGCNWYYDAANTPKYIRSTYASSYWQYQGQHQWYTAPSGTAGATATLTQAMTLDANGNLGIGTTSPAYKLDVSGGGGSISTARVINGNVGGSDGAQILLGNSANFTNAYFRLNGGGNSSQAGIGSLNIGVTESVPMAFYTNNAERARIDSSGNLLVGTTTTSGITNGSSDNAHAFISFEGNVNAQRNNGACAYFSKASGYTSSTLVSFYVTGSERGSITTSGTTVAYNTSSDYRLKENIAPMTGALAKVAALKPCTYNWKSTGEASEGFIAHELAEVVPQCVTGAKDAVDEDGNPVYQGIDTSFLVATLTAAIQELNAKVQALEAQLNKGA